jgi:hypothetical protein
MAIDVICPGCHTRFKVSDKFAGKQGPCPKCKTVIKIPEKGDEVVVHVPEDYGPKDSRGRAVLKPIARKETFVSLPMAIGIGGAVLVVLVAALLMRGFEDGVPVAVLAFGAIVLAPPLVLGGYTFLRDDELEPHRGLSLCIRVGICSLAYVVLWAAYAWLPGLAFHLDELELFHLLFLVPPLVVAGATAAFASLDLDFGSALIHYGMYLLVTLSLCLLMGVSLLGTTAS